MNSPEIKKYEAISSKNNKWLYFFLLMIVFSLHLSCTRDSDPRFNKYQILYNTREYKSSSTGIKKIEDTYWSPGNRILIDEFILKTAGIKNKSAVFDCDKTIINGDITDGAKKGKLEIDGVFGELIKSKKLVGADYTRDIYKDYLKLCSLDKMKGYMMPVEMLKGLKQDEVISVAQKIWEKEYQYLIYPESKAVIRKLVENGFEVYIISASASEFVKPISKFIGVPEENIYGVAQAVENGILSGRIIEPFPYGEGKVRVIKDVFKIRPLYVQGDSMNNDGPMLDYAVKNGGLSVFINPSDEAIRKKAEERGFLLQYNPSWEVFYKTNMLDDFIRFFIGG